MIEKNKDILLGVGSLALIGAGVAAGAITVPAALGLGAAGATALSLVNTLAGVGGSIAASQFMDLVKRPLSAPIPFHEDDFAETAGTALKLFFTVRMKEKHPNDTAILNKLGEAATRVWQRVAAKGRAELERAPAPNLPLLLLARRDGETIFEQTKWEEFAEEIFNEAKLDNPPYLDSIRKGIVRELQKWLVHDFGQVLKHNAQVGGRQMATFQVYAFQEIIAGQRATLEAIEEIREEQESDRQEILSAINLTSGQLDTLAGEVRALLRSVEMLVCRTIALHKTFDSDRIESLSRSLGVAHGAIGACLSLLGSSYVPMGSWPEELMEFATRYRELERLVDGLEPVGPEARELRQGAKTALGNGNLEQVDALLARIPAIEDEATARSEEHLRSQKTSAAQTRATRAQVAMLKWAFREAAGLYGEASRLIEPFNAAMAQRYRDRRAEALYQQGVRKEDNGALNDAIAVYRAALEEYTRERAPLDWAMTQSNLGNALLTLGERESGTERLEEAVAACRAALEECTRERAPLDWAMTQNNLGAALWTLGQRESGTERLKEAVAAYHAALGERTRERVPLDWAVTQSNLGIALTALGERESGAEWLEEAVTAYRAALQEHTRQRAPREWAMTQNNLGYTLATIGEREGDLKRLEEGVVANRAALEEYTRERLPFDWATTQHNLGNMLLALGEREGSTERLEEAVAAYQAALEECTRERAPLDWSTTQHNLGYALALLGELEDNTGQLEEAVAAYRGALEERARKRVPLSWAGTQNNLGNALRTLGERESGTERLEEAVAAYCAALEVFQSPGLEYYRNNAERCLDETLALIQERKGG